MVVGKELLISGTHMVGTNKSLGQHWLKNRAILEMIADLVVDETATIRLCLEIGPGLGFLTSSLLKRFERVIAVEYDERLAKNLPKSFPGKNLTVIQGDFLTQELNYAEKYVIAGNIPYYITSPIIEKILTAEKLPEKVVLLMQKEVAERIVDEKETLLSLFVKNRAEVIAGPKVLAREFTPPPKVDSQVLVLMPHAPKVDEKVFALIKKSFRSPRKKLVHNLSGLKTKEELVNILRDLEINPDARPGDLHLNNYYDLYCAIM